MKTNLTLLIAVLCLSVLVSTKVQAAIEYEELTYDDLVNQLSDKRDQASQKNARGTEAKTHFGLGVVNSWTQVVTGGRTYSNSLNGFEVSTGMDLNSERIRGELAFRNFFDKTGGSQSVGLRELAMGVGVRRPMNATWRAKFGGGMAVRALHFSDSSQSVDIDDTSSMLMAAGGLEARLSPSVSVGGDLSTRLPFGTVTADRNSIDLGFKLDTTF